MGLDAARRLEQTISTRNAKTRTVLELLFGVLGVSSGRAHEAGAPLQLPHLQVKVHQECTNKTDVLLGGTPIFPIITSAPLSFFLCADCQKPGLRRPAHICRSQSGAEGSASSMPMQIQLRRPTSPSSTTDRREYNAGRWRRGPEGWPLPSRFRLEEAHAPDADL